MKKITTAIKNLLVAGLLVFVSYSFADSASSGIAVVNLTQVFQQVPQGQAAFAKLQKKVAPEAAKLQDQQTTLNKQIQAFQASKTSLPALQQATQERNLAARQQKLQQSIRTYQASLRQQQRQLLTIFDSNMKTAVAQIAKTRGYHLILSGQNALYDDNAVDITPLVVQAMK
jgi:outer membrane protein